jgi:beta-lactamase class A
MDALGLPATRALNVPSVWFQGLRAAESPEQFYREGKYRFGVSTAREMGRLLELMERRALVDAASSDLMLQIMRWQLYRARIPRYISGYQIAHKTGDFAPYVEDDVGVLEVDDRRIIVCIFTGNHFGSAQALESAIGVVAKDVADYFAYRA